MPASPSYYVSPTILIGAVDFSSLCSEATITAGFDTQEITAFGDAGHVEASTLKSVEISAKFFGTYGTGELEEALYNALGDGTTTVTLYPNGASPSTSNPEWEVTNTMLKVFTPVNAKVGEIVSFDVTFTSGTWARSTS